VFGFKFWLVLVYITAEKFKGNKHSEGAVTQLFFAKSFSARKKYTGR